MNNEFAKLCVENNIVEVTKLLNAESLNDLDVPDMEKGILVASYLGYKTLVLLILRDERNRKILGLTDGLKRTRMMNDGYGGKTRITY